MVSFLKKAQLEIMGLVIIVALIIVIALFFIRFSLISPVAHSQAQTSIITNNVLNALIQVSVCEKKQLADIIITCSESPNTAFCGKDACTYAKDEISQIIAKLGYTQADYVFIAKSRQNNQEQEIMKIGQCNLNDNVAQTLNVIASSPYTIHSKGNIYTFTMYRCMQ